MSSGAAWTRRKLNNNQSSFFIAWLSSGTDVADNATTSSLLATTFPIIHQSISISTLASTENNWDRSRMLVDALTAATTLRGNKWQVWKNNNNQLFMKMCVTYYYYACYYLRRVCKWDQRRWEHRRYSCIPILRQLHLRVIAWTVYVAIPWFGTQYFALVLPNLLINSELLMPTSLSLLVDRVCGCGHCRTCGHCALTHRRNIHSCTCRSTSIRVGYAIASTLGIIHHGTETALCLTSTSLRGNLLHTQSSGDEAELTVGAGVWSHTVIRAGGGRGGGSSVITTFGANRFRDASVSAT
jgi:hypothetical protein